MTETIDSPPAQTRQRLRWDAVAQLVLAAAVAGLAITFSYGLSVEYSDTAASDLSVARRSFVDWWIGLAIVFLFAAGAVAAARRSRGRRAMTALAAAVAAVTLIGIPAGAVIGAHEKFERYPDLPTCTSGFNGGPAVPVVRASQDRFVELDHPGPFSGGGSSGVDGCATQLMVDGDVDVPAHYRPTLREHGWRIDRYDRSLVSATRDGQGFEAARDRDGSWWVWIGPAGLMPSDSGLEDGQVQGP